ncbi:MAG TPA: hypothetical protein VL947_10885, partial [Cytophagales bacterium]|nr:hypothetical protein [Cytophagales bacterium]
IVKDHAGCTGRQKITINARNCTEVKDYSFDPTVDKLSIGPMVDAGALNIHSKGGTLVYKHDFSDGALLEWDGRDPSGNIVSNGVYLYTVFKGPEVVQKGYIHIVSSH